MLIPTEPVEANMLDGVEKTACGLLKPCSPQQLLRRAQVWCVLPVPIILFKIKKTAPVMPIFLFSEKAYFCTAPVPFFSRESTRCTSVIPLSGSILVLESLSDIAKTSTVRDGELMRQDNVRFDMELLCGDGKGRDFR